MPGSPTEESSFSMLRKSKLFLQKMPALDPPVPVTVSLGGLGAYRLTLILPPAVTHNYQPQGRLNLPVCEFDSSSSSSGLAPPYAVPFSADADPLLPSLLELFSTHRTCSRSFQSTWWQNISHYTSRPEFDCKHSYRRGSGHI